MMSRRHGNYTIPRYWPEDSRLANSVGKQGKSKQKLDRDEPRDDDSVGDAAGGARLGMGAVGRGAQQVVQAVL
jgi:hypothetical protein